MKEKGVLKEVEPNSGSEEFYDIGLYRDGEEVLGCSIKVDDKEEIESMLDGKSIEDNPFVEIEFKQTEEAEEDGYYIYKYWVIDITVIDD